MVERRALDDRRAVVADALRPGDRAEMGLAISTMFSGFPSVRMDAEAARTALALYVSGVDHLPIWAVHAGCRAAVTRNTPFPPSAGEFRALCERTVEDPRKELSELEAILNADVYHEPSSAEREKVKAGFEAVLRDLGLREDAPARRAPAGRERAFAAQIEDAPPTAMRLSDEARMKMGIRPATEEQMD